MPQAITEFRIALPLTCEEFHRGQLFSIAEISLAEGEKVAGEGVEWLKNEPYDNTDGSLPVSAITGVKPPVGKGQYTLKRLHFKSKIPWVLSKLAPTDALYLIEEAWNAYPHCKTVLVSGYLKYTSLRIDVETMHVGGAGCLDLDNAVGLSAEELAARKIETLSILDVAKDPHAKDYSPALDMSKWRSVKASRGPLAAGWDRAADAELKALAAAAGGGGGGGAGSGGSASADAPKGPALMVCYKVVRIDCNMWGVEGTVKSLTFSSQKGLFGKSLCQAAATLDKWHDTTWADIRAMEQQVAEISNKKLKDKEEKEGKK